MFPWIWNPEKPFQKFNNFLISAHNTRLRKYHSKSVQILRVRQAKVVRVESPGKLLSSRMC